MDDIKQTVGHHTYFNIGAFDAREKVQRNCPDGWRAGVKIGSEPLPAGAVLVGQVKVHHGDPPYPLYVYPAA